MRSPRATAIRLLLIALLLTPALASGRQGQGTRASDDVRAAVATAGVSEVIVRVRQAFQMEGRLDRSAALAQRARLRDRQARIIDRLPRGVRARRFQLTPYFAARVDAAALARLESDPDVVSIEADKRMHADLA